MAKDEHFNLFILITLLLDIASSSYISQETGQERPREELTLTKETATKHVDDTFIVVCKDQRGLPVTWKGPKGRLGAKTHPKVHQGSYGTSIVFDKIRSGDSGNYTCTAGGSKKTRIFTLKVEDLPTTTQISTTSETSSSFEISNNNEETDTVESTFEETIEPVNTYINTYAVVTTTEESVVHPARPEHRHNNHGKKPKDNKSTLEDVEHPVQTKHRHKNNGKKPKDNKTALETNNIPPSTTEENVENTNDDSINSNLLTTTEESEITSEVNVDLQTHFNEIPSDPLEDFNFTKTPDIQESIEGQTAKIICRTNLDNVDTSWSLANGEVLTNELNHLNGGSAFIIKNVSRNDANVYTCQALHKNTGRMIYKNITFVVQHKPYPVYAQENIVYGFIDEVLNLTCEVEANPPPRIRWQPKNKGSIIEETSHKSVLQLNITEDVPGDYKCITSNKVGTFEKIFTVEIGVRPNRPENVSLVEATSTSLEISIQLGNISADDLPTNMEPTTLLIEYRPALKGESEWVGVKLNITVEGACISELDENTEYEIRVATINGAGIVSEYYDSIFKTTSLAVSIHMKSPVFNILVYLVMLLISKFWLA